MKKTKLFIQQHWFGICVFLILILAIFLRFYNYENRWGLAYDQARDALVAREALRQHKIPVLGPFSQAGSFVMGPIWYWLVALATSVYPNSILTPWVILTISYVLVVYIMILIGKELDGKSLALILGIFTAISTAQIAQSTDLTNPSGIAILSASALYFAIKYVKTGRKLFIFLSPFFISLAINVHLQAIGLLFLIPPMVAAQRPNLKKISFLLIGIVIPFIPLIVFDIAHNFYDTRSMIDYFLYGQYRIYIPNRWLTYLGIFWPNTWAKIIGGWVVLGYLTIGFLTITTLYALFSKKITKPFLTLIISFLLILIMFRYFRGEKFDGYFVFLHPFVITLTGWMVLTLYKRKAILGLLLIFLIIGGSIQKDIQEIKKSENYTAYVVKVWINKILEKYPHEKFAVYDLEYARRDKSLPLALFLDRDKRIDDRGLKIGLTIATSGSQFKHPVILGDRGGYQILDLNSSTSAELSTEGWVFINPSQIYHSTQEWYVGKNL